MAIKLPVWSRLEMTEEQTHFLAFSPSIGGWLRKKLFGISPEEATFAKRKFYASNPDLQQRLETIGKTFLQGYEAAIASDGLEDLIAQLNLVEAELQGFAYEGAAMGLTLLDYFTLRSSRRVQSLLADAGSNHIYMVYVGVGWMLARLPGSLKHYLDQLNPKKSSVVYHDDNLVFWQSNSASTSYPDPLFGWLAIDGYGFHQGYFYWQKYVRDLAMPKELSGYACRVFDRGLGRSLWFVKGADVRLIAQTIENFQPDRRGDLWAGVGLACAYAGGVAPEAVEDLKRLAGSYLPQLAQGVAFAAKARLRANNLARSTETASEILCGMKAEAAARITDRSLIDLPQGEEIPAYEIWQQRIQAHFC